MEAVSADSLYLYKDFQHMVDRSDILFSEYIIDGASMESTPADMLKECMPAQMWEQFLNRWHNALKDNGGQDRGVMRPAPIIDETRDKVPVMNAGR